MEQRIEGAFLGEKYIFFFPHLRGLLEYRLSLNWMLVIFWNDWASYIQLFSSEIYWHSSFAWKQSLGDDLEFHTSSSVKWPITEPAVVG